MTTNDAVAQAEAILQEASEEVNAYERHVTYLQKLTRLLNKQVRAGDWAGAQYTAEHLGVQVGAGAELYNRIAADLRE